MLVLSRKEGERIVIGDGIAIQVVEINGNKVRLGIVADESVLILREEVVPKGSAAHKFLLELTAQGSGT